MKLFSSVDSTWLRMERPTNLMMITAVIGFGVPVDFERLKATLENRLLRFERFRQRVVGSFPCWEDDPQVDLDYHLRRVRLPPPGDQAALQKVVSELMSTPLDFSRPLWQMHLVEPHGAGAALIVRLHHCVADGIALLHVLLSLTDAGPEAPYPTDAPEAARPGRDLPEPDRPAGELTETLLRESLELLASPSRLTELRRLAGDVLTSAGRLLSLEPDPKTLFKGQLGTSKQAAWSAPVALADVKAIGQAVGGSVNDVLLAATAGALRRYLRSHGEPVDSFSLHATVPVNLRPPNAEPSLGNKFGLVFLPLPVNLADPIARLCEIKQHMDEIKRSAEAALVFTALGVIGLAPKAIHDEVVDIFGSRATTVVTNMAGPREKRYMAGCPIESLMFWVPQSGRLGIGVSIISYAGQVWLGVATDQGLAPDPEAIIAAFQAELNALSALAPRIEAGPSQAIQPMLDRLDQALKTLDELLDKRRRTTSDE